MRNSTHVRLHTARLEQLRQIAQHYGETIAETVDRMIAKEIGAGVIPDTIPGLAVVALERAILLHVGKLPVTVRPIEAAAVARQLGKLIKGSETKGFRLDATGDVLTIARQGSGIMIGAKDSAGQEARQSLTISLARDLRKQLLKAARSFLPTEQ